MTTTTINHEALAFRRLLFNLSDLPALGEWANDARDEAGRLLAEKFVSEHWGESVCGPDEDGRRSDVTDLSDRLGPALMGDWEQIDWTCGDWGGGTVTLPDGSWCATAISDAADRRAHCHIDFDGGTFKVRGRVLAMRDYDDESETTELLGIGATLGAAYANLYAKAEDAASEWCVPDDSATAAQEHNREVKEGR